MIFLKTVSSNKHYDVTREFPLHTTGWRACIVATSLVVRFDISAQQCPWLYTKSRETIQECHNAWLYSMFWEQSVQSMNVVSKRLTSSLLGMLRAFCWLVSAVESECLTARLQGSKPSAVSSLIFDGFWSTIARSKVNTLCNMCVMV